MESGFRVEGCVPVGASQARGGIEMAVGQRQRDGIVSYGEVQTKLVEWGLVLTRVRACVRGQRLMVWVFMSMFRRAGRSSSQHAP
jgi:hypothetical protein